MDIIVQKYGGSSLADTDKIKEIAKKISNKVEQGNKLAVVVSAMGDTTDELEKLAEDVSQNPSAREMDMLITTGEQVSASLVSMALNERDIDALSLNAFQAEIATNEAHNQASIEKINSKKLKEYFGEYEVLIITGFQGISSEGHITTLGRGGSDTSAVAIAAALDAPCEIYSDFAGIFTTDPRHYSEAKKIKQISYDEILEMARLGSNVLHPRAVEIAKKYNVTLYCGGTFSEEEGTTITSEPLEKSVVTGLSIMDNQTQVTISNLPPDHIVVNEMFKYMGRKHVNIDMISIINIDNSINLSFSYVETDQEYFKQALKDFQKDFKDSNIRHKHNYTKVSVVGLGMRSEKGVASRFFTALEDVPIELVTTSEIKISCLIDKKYKEEALQSLAEEFDL